MSELSGVPNILAAAETAANAGDLAIADDLLQRAARIQEAELGPLHPDLANTLNNLAIVAETTGRLDDAEKFYRRAVAITSASLPADDPMVASSRANLEAFCRDRGVPIDRPPIAPSPELTLPERTPEADGFARDDGAVEVEVSGTAHPARLSRVFAAAAIVLLAVASLFIVRSRLTRETTPQTQTAEPAARPAEPAPSPPPPSPTAASPPAAPPSIERREPPVTTARPSPLAGAISVVAQLCGNFSTSGGRWRCDPVENPVAPGPIVLYTRVKSPRDAVVIHQWYRGNALRKFTRLTIRASPTEGYRTYSRQTVRSAEEWRVEVRTASGDLLYEQRLAVAAAAR